MGDGLHVMGAAEGAHAPDIRLLLLLVQTHMFEARQACTAGMCAPRRT